jgi:hypothetical protein
MRFARRSNDPDTITSLTPSFRSALQELGYDGISDIGGQIIGNEEHTVWIALDASQIMSALDPVVLDMTVPKCPRAPDEPAELEQTAMDRLEGWRASRSARGAGPDPLA